MKQIDPNSIESVNVLKDKNATDKYGGKGQNGVIEIITKKTAAVKAETSAAGNNADNSVVISQNGNSFSGQSKVVISERGKDVKGVNDILYVLNGKIIEKKQFDKVNPDEIKSVNVLKDKPATDKYGEKGKNGVIEVVTKSGE